MLAKQAGVDAVKLQKRDNRRLFTRALYDSPYDNENSFGPTYGAHREALELDRDAYVELQACARELGLVFFATAFDEASADLLEELDVPAYKIASGDLRNTPLLRHVAAFGKPLIVSTGGATLEDVDRAVEAVTAINPQLCLLQCTASYPAAVEELELGVIATYRERYPELVVGLSDHQDGIAMAPVAYMLGARVIEKHFTSSHTAKGTDHAFSLDARGHAEARPRPPPRPGRDRRRRQAAAPERGRAAAEDGEAARRRAAPPGRARPRRRRPRGEVAGRGRPAAVSARRADRQDARARAGRGRGDPRRGRATRRCARGSTVVGSTASGEVPAWGRAPDTGDLPGGQYDRAMMDPFFDLTGRVAVVTGGMGQLGAELSVALASRGHARGDPRPRDDATGRRSRGSHERIDDGTVRAHACDVTDRAQVEAALALVEVDWGVPRPARQRRGDRRAAGRAGGGGRPVRGRARRVARAGRPRERARRRRSLPGDRRRDGAGRARLDRQRRLGLRPPLARPGPLRLPPRGGRDVLQAGRVLGLEVGAAQPDPLPGDLLGPERRARQHADAARDRERAAGPFVEAFAAARRSGG